MTSTTRLVLSLAVSLGTANPLMAQPRGRTTLSAPSGVTVTSSPAGLTVSWTNVKHATGYTVHRLENGSIVNLVSSHPGTPYMGPLPTAGAPYQYQVVALQLLPNGAVNSAASAWVSYTVPPMAVPGTGTVITEPRPPGGTPTVVPAGPASLTAVSNAPGQITLTWAAVANASGYRITRSSDIAAENDLIHVAPATTYTNTPVEIGRTFTYKVFAFFGTAPSTTVSTSSPAASAASRPIAQPVELRLYKVEPAAAAGVVNATYTWNAGSLYGVEKFVVWLGTGQVLGYPTTIQYVHANVTAGQTHTVCVAAIYPLGLRDDKTAPCTSISIRTGPSQLLASSTIPGQIDLRWPSVQGASVYRILRSSSSGEVAYDLPASTAQVNGMYAYANGPVEFSPTYTFKVLAGFQLPAGIIHSGSSPWINARSVPFVQVSGITFTVVPSTAKIGTLDVTLNWVPLAGAAYEIVASDGTMLGQTSSPSFVYRGVPPRHTYNVCVRAVYAYNIRDDRTAPCIVIPL